MEIRLLQADDHRASFRSGDGAEDYYFLHFAQPGSRGGTASPPLELPPAGPANFLGSPYVAVAGRRILGFLVAMNAEVQLPDRMLPVLRISRLALDLNARGHGIARALLAFGLGRLRSPGQSVVVDTLAPHFFAPFGFEPIELAQGQLGLRPLRVSMFLAAGAMEQA